MRQQSRMQLDNDTGNDDDGATVTVVTVSQMLIMMFVPGQPQCICTYRALFHMVYYLFKLTSLRKSVNISIILIILYEMQRIYTYEANLKADNL